MRKKSQIKKSTPKSKVLELAKDCKKRGHCCTYSSGTVLKSEIKKLARHFNMAEKEFKKKYLSEQEKFNTKHFRFKQIKGTYPYGRCIFLKDNLCGIHKIKPLHCKVTNCNEHGQDLSTWFTLNYFVNENDPESVRQWAIYLKTHKTIPGGRLDELVPDKKMLKKILNFEVLK